MTIKPQLSHIFPRLFGGIFVLALAILITIMTGEIKIWAVLIGLSGVLTIVFLHKGTITTNSDTIGINGRTISTGNLVDFDMVQGTIEYLNDGDEKEIQLFNPEIYKQKDLFELENWLLDTVKKRSH